MIARVLSPQRFYNETDEDICSGIRDKNLIQANGEMRAN